MDFLKDILGEELFDQVAEKLKGNEKVKLANLADGEYVGKDKFLKAEKAANDLKDELATRDTDLETLKKSIADGEGDGKQIKADFEALQTKHKEASNGFQKDAKDYEIKLAVLQAGAKNGKSVMAHLDKEKITLADGKLSGLSDQIELIAKDHDYLFGEPKKVFKSDPLNPPSKDEGDKTKNWQNKYDEASKTGKSVDKIKVKQAAFEDGVIIQ